MKKKKQKNVLPICRESVDYLKAILYFVVFKDIPNNWTQSTVIQRCQKFWYKYGDHLRILKGQVFRAEHSFYLCKNEVDMFYFNFEEYLKMNSIHEVSLIDVEQSINSNSLILDANDLSTNVSLWSLVLSGFEIYSPLFIDEDDDVNVDGNDFATNLLPAIAMHFYRSTVVCIFCFFSLFLF